MQGRLIGNVQFPDNTALQTVPDPECRYLHPPQCPDASTPAPPVATPLTDTPAPIASPPPADTPALTPPPVTTPVAIPLPAETPAPVPPPTDTPAPVYPTCGDPRRSALHLQRDTRPSSSTCADRPPHRSPRLPETPCRRSATCGDTRIRSLPAGSGHTSSGPARWHRRLSRCALSTRSLIHQQSMQQPAFPEAKRLQRPHIHSLQQLHPPPPVARAPVPPPPDSSAPPAADPATDATTPTYIPPTASAPAAGRSPLPLASTCGSCNTRYASVTVCRANDMMLYSRHHALL